MSEGTIEQSGHFGEALYNILLAALSKHDEVWQDAEKARQLRSRLIEILNVPIEIPGGRDGGVLPYGRPTWVGTSSGFDSPAALLTAFLSILKLV